MGVANLIADGISMGFGDFLSSYYENLYIIFIIDKHNLDSINRKLKILISYFI